MITSLKMDAFGDLVVGTDGNLAFVVGLDAVAQNCLSAMRAQRGEMIYAQDRGMPYFDTVWNQYLPEQFEAAARATLLAVKGVTSVQSFTFTVQNNVLSYAAEITTIYGSTTIGG